MTLSRNVASACSEISERFVKDLRKVIAYGMKHYVGT